MSLSEALSTTAIGTVSEFTRRNATGKYFCYVMMEEVNEERLKNKLNVNVNQKILILIKINF